MHKAMCVNISDEIVQNEWHKDQEGTSIANTWSTVY